MPDAHVDSPDDDSDESLECTGETSVCENAGKTRVNEALRVVQLRWEQAQVVPSCRA